jgi:hypothetical protein
MEESEYISPKELIKRYQKTSLPDIHRAIQDDRLNSSYWGGWEIKAVAEFRFPISVFNLTGEADSTPFERYIYVSRLLIPENLSYLNKLCQVWDVQSEDIDLNLSLDYEELTKERWEEAGQEMEDSLDNDFTISNHLILNSRTEWTRFIHDQSDEIKRVQGEDNLKTLIRGYREDAISYRDILDSCRVFFRGNDGEHIENFKFAGFSPEGFPVLSVNIAWG